MNGNTQPIFPDVGVLAIVPDRWDAHWQTRHHLISRLVKHFHVVWCNPVQEWRLVKFDGKFSPWFRTEHHSAGFVEHTFSSLLPKLYRPAFAARLAERIRMSRAQASLNGTPIKKWIIYLWRPQYASVLDNTTFDVSCYHIDDEYSFSQQEQPNDPAEIAVIKRVDQVFIHSKALLEKKGGINPNTLRIPNGVDFEAYSTVLPEPEELRGIPHPRLGYIGYIKTHLNLKLHLDLAANRPDWQFVFLGPVGILGDAAPVLDALFALPNVHYLGAKHPSVLPAYASHFDVCLMGYAINDYTKYIYPLKMHEYLATGVPVISTPIPAAKEYAHVLTIADGLSEWQSAVEEALLPMARSDEAVSRRREAARQLDWNVLADRVAEAMCRHLGPEYLQRLNPPKSTADLKLV